MQINLNTLASELWKIQVVNNIDYSSSSESLALAYFLKRFSILIFNNLQLKKNKFV